MFIKNARRHLCQPQSEGNANSGKWCGGDHHQPQGQPGQFALCENAEWGQGAIWRKDAGETSRTGKCQNTTQAASMMMRTNSLPDQGFYYSVPISLMPESQTALRIRGSSQRLEGPTLGRRNCNPQHRIILGISRRLITEDFHRISHNTLITVQQ